MMDKKKIEEEEEIDSIYIYIYINDVNIFHLLFIS